MKPPSDDIKRVMIFFGGGLGRSGPEKWNKRRNDCQRNVFPGFAASTSKDICSLKNRRMLFCEPRRSQVPFTYSDFPVHSDAVGELEKRCRASAFLRASDS